MHVSEGFRVHVCRGGGEVDVHYFPADGRDETERYPGLCRLVERVW